MNRAPTAAEPAPPNDATVEAVAMAAAAGLIYVSDAEPGIRRKRKGRRFVYVTPDGSPLTSAAALKRIAGLAIPPAYEDVWICTQARGHLQATGRDARGRKQYRYHHDWRIKRDGAKFERMVEFGEALPRLRRRLRRDRARPGLPREKVLAVLVSLLDATLIRIGNAEYARDNKSFGLTTLRNRHVQFIRDGRALLRFRGKSGLEHEVAIDDKRLARIVRHCQELPGQKLFQYVDDNGRHRPVDSGQVNDYLRDAMGEDFTAKDFRTWGATLRAVFLMEATPLPSMASERALNSRIAHVVRQVAAELRNTPAVCRKSYINPVVFDAWRRGALHAALPANLKAAPRQAERHVLAFLRHEAREADRLNQKIMRAVARLAALVGGGFRIAKAKA
jgi:DNA topoisomerase IB